MRLTRDAFRVIALAWPIVTTMLVIVAMIPMLKVDEGSDLLGPLSLLVIVTAGTLVAYVAGIERPAETHEFCDPSLCIHKRDAPHRRRKERNGC